jgi:hypothetical protein
VQFFSLKYFIGIPLIKPGACTRQSKYMWSMSTWY